MTICDARACIVTGAGRGIGRAHALALAAEGAAVVVNDIGAALDGSTTSFSPADEVVDAIEALGGRAVASYDDISTWDGAQRAVARSIEAFGHLDVVVNNAGILRDRMIVNMTEDDWSAVMNVHLRGTFAMTRWAAVYWRDEYKAGRPVDARVINTSSVSGLYGNVGQANYGAAKAGIAAFTTIAAKELGRYGVTVNAVAPAALTRMSENFNGVLGIAEDEIAEVLAPRWVAALVTWLASAGSASVTGQVIDISGQRIGIAEGWHLGPEGAPSDDPSLVGEIVRSLLQAARPPADIRGYEQSKDSR